MIGNEILPAVQNGNGALTAGSVTQYIERKKRNHQTANQQADTVDCIRNGNRLESAEDSVNRSDNADCNTQNTDRLELGDAQQSRQIEDIFKYQ